LRSKTKRKSGVRNKTAGMGGMGKKQSGAEGHLSVTGK